MITTAARAETTAVISIIFLYVLSFIILELPLLYVLVLKQFYYAPWH